MKPRLRMYTLDSVDSLCRKSAFRDREPRDCESSEIHLVKCDILKDSCFFHHSSLEPVVAVPKVSAIVWLGVTRLGGLNLNARSQVKTFAALAELPACQTPPTLWLSRHKEAERIERRGIEGCQILQAFSFITFLRTGRLAQVSEILTQLEHLRNFKDQFGRSSWR